MSLPGRPRSDYRTAPHEGSSVTQACSSATERTLLCVDDEPNITSALRRVFRGTGWRMLAAGSGAQALEAMQSEAVDLVISDMRMPGMDGAQLLEQVRRDWPQVVRILLTGQSDTASTLAAINRGEVYRYITKPWNDDEIVLTVRQAFERQDLERETRRLHALTQQQNGALAALNADLERKVDERTAELQKANERLRKTYITSIKVFSGLIELRGGSLAGHSRRVAEQARRTALAMGRSEHDALQVSIAGLLHDIGHIGLSDDLLARPVSHMSDADLAQYRRHAVLGEQSLLALDDLQGVASLIRSHHERYDGKGYPDGLAGRDVPFGARILAVADAYDDLQHRRLTSAALEPAQARQIIARGRGTQFDPEVVDVFLQTLLHAAAAPAPRLVAKVVAELEPGMVLGRELVSADGVVLITAEQVLTADLIARLHRYAQRNGTDPTLWVHPGEERGSQ